MSLKLTRRVHQLVLTISSEVRYRTLRRPTVIEKMVLRLILAATREPLLARLGLATAFEDELGMAEAERLLEPVVIGLCQVGLLLPSFDLSGASPRERLEAMDTPLGDWGLDPRAEDYLTRGQVPRRTQTRSLQHVFDPVSHEIRPARERSPLGDEDDIPDFTLPIPDPSLNDLAERVRAQLPTERNDWLKADTEILEITPERPARAWRPVTLEITVADDGTVAVRAPQSPSVETWLRQADPEPLWPLLAALLSGAETTAPLRMDHHMRVEPTDLASLDPVEHGLPAKLRLELRPANTPGMIQVIEWLNNRPRELPMARPPGLPAGWRSMQIGVPGELPVVDLAGTMSLHWAGQIRSIPVCGRMASQKSEAMFTLLTDAICLALTEVPNPAGQVMRVWFDAPSEVLGAWAVRADTLGDAERLESLAQLLEQMRLRLPPARISGDAAVASRLQEILTRRSPLSNEAARTRLLDAGRALLRAAVLLPEALRMPLNSRLVELLPPLQHLAEAQTLREALGADEVALPMRLLTPLLREELLEAALDEQPSGCGAHALAGPIQQFVRLWKQARRDIDPVLLATTPDLDHPSADWLQAATRRVARLEKAVRTAHQGIDTLSRALEGEPARLALIRVRLDAIAHWMDWNLAPALPATEQVRVLDTSVLMNHAALLDTVPTSIRLVLPQRVLQELDGLKRGGPEDKSDERQKQAARARAAIAAIERHHTRLDHEPDHPELWPTAVMSSDERILSAALFWSRSEVRLWSDDRNLRNLAQSCGLAAESPPNFQEHRSAHGRVPARPHRPESRR